MLKGKKALITGASRGIGRAIALAMAAEGADVAIIYQGNAGAAESTRQEAEQLGVKACCYQCDVADEAAVRQTLKRALADLGGLDILVNNAGITRDGLLPLMKEEDFLSVLHTNLLGSYHMLRHSCMHFIKQRGGRLIFMSSVIGLMGNAGQANYAAAKAGMIGLMKSAARELAPRGITCNAIAPGFISTDMTSNLPEDSLAQATAAIPLARLGKPEDVAQLAVFLASDKASYITGAVIPVDGGMSL